MDAEGWARVEQLCQDALERNEQQQTEFLDSACGANQELRREVESLLAHRRSATTFLETPAVQLAAKAFTEEPSPADGDKSRLIGRLISHYRIMEKIASGGMGDVYRATRADGMYDKQVAIKIIQGSRSTDFFLARFQNERQILADLDHPNIARLVDGGTTEEGLPYLVMEFVEGTRIDEFCDHKKLGVNERLELFRAVCSAVHYAHQNLFVHRDLKPSNIFVTADGVPKLLDFGIAKILDPQRDAGTSQQTITLLRMLTPDYASPEQVLNKPIATSSDVYSLGVILYELLTGRLPYRASGDSPQEMMKAVCDTEPEKPSTAVLRDAEAMHSASPLPDGQRARQAISREDAQKLQKALAGDLDNIVLKALRKDPQRRYISVEQFSEDVRRYLVGLPVVAHEDSLPYRARKFVGRHTFAVGGAILLFLSLAGGFVATLWQAHIARAERLRAARRFNDVRKLANSLIFEIHDGIQDLPGSIPVRGLLVERAAQYLDSLSQEAAGDSTLQRELASAYERLAGLQFSTDFANRGDQAASLRSYRKALAIRESVAKENPKDLTVQIELANACLRFYDPLESVGHFQDALDAVRKALSIADAVKDGSNDPQVRSLSVGSHYYLGRILNEMGDSAGALDSYRKAAAILETMSQKDPRAATLIRTHLAGAYAGIAESMMLMGDDQEAMKVQVQAVRILEELSQSNPTSASLQEFLANSCDLLGTLCERKGEHNKAMEYRRRAHEIFGKLLQSDPQNELARANFGFSEESLGESLVAVGNVPAALPRIREALALFETMAAKGSKLRYVSSGIADCYFAFGMADSSIAVSSHGRALQMKKWNEARTWFQRSAHIWSEKRNQGSLDGGERETAERVSQGITNCEIQLSKLGDNQRTR
jgi:eukaryotic-like serine/threonine-protein kinase